MLLCKTKPNRKNADKIEGMASWLILGGVLPLAVDIVVRHQPGYYSFDSFFAAPNLAPYLLVIAMGVASLGVKRASWAWQGIVVMGVVGVVAAAILSLGSGAGATLWPVFVLLIVCKQYQCDMGRAGKTG